MSENIFTSNQIALVKVEELPAFLPHLCKDAAFGTLWRLTDRDDSLMELALSFKQDPLSEPAVDKKTGLKPKTLAVGVKLPIPYAQSHYLFFGFLPEDFIEVSNPKRPADAQGENLEETLLERCRLWLLPESVELSGELRHGFLMPNQAIAGLYVGRAQSNKDFSAQSLAQHEIKSKLACNVLSGLPPESLYLRNLMVSASSPTGEVALFPSKMEMFGHLLCDALNEFYPILDGVEKWERLLSSCAQDLTSAIEYSFLHTPLIERTWLEGRPHFKEGYMSLFEPSKRFLSLILKIDKAISFTSFTAADALALEDLNHLGKTQKFAQEISERKKAFVQSFFKVELNQKTESSRVAVRVSRLKTKEKWVVLGKEERSIENPIGDIAALSISESRFREPKNFEPSMLYDNETKATDAIDTLIQLEGVDESRFVATPMACATAQQWVELLKYSPKIKG